MCTDIASRRKKRNTLLYRFPREIHVSAAKAIRICTSFLDSGALGITRHSVPKASVHGTACYPSTKLVTVTRVFVDRTFFSRPLPAAVSSRSVRPSPRGPRRPIKITLVLRVRRTFQRRSNNNYRARGREQPKRRRAPAKLPAQTARYLRWARSTVNFA